MQPQTFHLWIPRGTSFRQTFQKRLGIRVAESVRISKINPANTVRVQPLPYAVSIGDVLDVGEFDCDGNPIIGIRTLTIVANAAQDSTSITVSSSESFSLCPGSPLAGKPIDLTGYTGNCQIRASYSDTGLLIAPTVIFPDPTNGFFAITIPDEGWTAAQAAAIAAGLTSIANCTWQELPDQNLQQIRSAYSDSLWAKGFPWDCELVAPTGETEREVQGLAFISDEVTR